jgi:hypothetical protein
MASEEGAWLPQGLPASGKKRRTYHGEGGRRRPQGGGASAGQKEVPRRPWRSWPRRRRGQSGDGGPGRVEEQAGGRDWPVTGIRGVLSSEVRAGKEVGFPGFFGSIGPYMNQ